MGRSAHQEQGSDAGARRAAATGIAVSPDTLFRRRALTAYQQSYEGGGQPASGMTPAAASRPNPVRKLRTRPPTTAGEPLSRRRDKYRPHMLPLVCVTQ